MTRWERLGSYWRVIPLAKGRLELEIIQEPPIEDGDYDCWAWCIYANSVEMTSGHSNSLANAKQQAMKAVHKLRAAGRKLRAAGAIP